MAQDPRQQERAEQWGQVVARAWGDETYKQRLLSDPKAVLAEAGLPIPPNVTVQVHEATATHAHVVLPPPPPGRNGERLSESELDQVAGGQLETIICLFSPFASIGIMAG
jgi:nitrile hydratase alpha subunit